MGWTTRFSSSTILVTGYGIARSDHGFGPRHPGHPSDAQQLENSTVCDALPLTGTGERAASASGLFRGHVTGQPDDRFSPRTGEPGAVAGRRHAPSCRTGPRSRGLCGLLQARNGSRMPFRACRCAPLAQSVEQLTLNQRAEGSIPSRRTARDQAAAPPGTLRM